MHRARAPSQSRRAHPAQRRACNEQTRTWCTSSFVSEPGPAGADPRAEAGLRGPEAEHDEERGEGEQQEAEAPCGARQVDGGAHPRGGGRDAGRERSWTSRGFVLSSLLDPRAYVKSIPSIPFLKAC